MLRWFVFTIAMGLLPFGFSALLQALRGVPPERWQNSPELLFFSVMVCAVQMGEIFTSLSAGGEVRPFKRAVLGSAFGMFLLGAILSAALYGVYADHERNDPSIPMGARCTSPSSAAAPAADAAPEAHTCTEWLAFQTNLYSFSIGLALLVGSVGTITEWTRTRRQP